MTRGKIRLRYHADARTDHVALLHYCSKKVLEDMVEATYQIPNVHSRAPKGSEL
jgi:hypothetical protein